jgi:hypothetical protein
MRQGPSRFGTDKKVFDTVSWGHDSLGPDVLASSLASAHFSFGCDESQRTHAAIVHVQFMSA